MLDEHAFRLVSTGQRRVRPLGGAFAERAFMLRSPLGRVPQKGRPSSPPRCLSSAGNVPGWGQIPQVMARRANGITNRLGVPAVREVACPTAAAALWADSGNGGSFRPDLLHAIMDRFPVIGDWFCHLRAPPWTSSLCPRYLAAGPVSDANLAPSPSRPCHESAPGIRGARRDSKRAALRETRPCFVRMRGQVIGIAVTATMPLRLVASTSSRNPFPSAGGWPGSSIPP
jgi:hypothetical protein